MKTKDKIVEILLEELDSVYCDNCNGKYCDGCRRKNMNWGLCEFTAEMLADKILEDE